MKKYFKEHAGTLLVLVVFFSLIGLAQNYGKAGGAIDKQFSNIFEQVGSQTSETIGAAYVS